MSLSRASRDQWRAFGLAIHHEHDRLQDKLDLASESAIKAWRSAQRAIDRELEARERLARVPNWIRRLFRAGGPC